jgi:threonine/homoserine/homoserine lactone efflux protein
MHEVLRNILLGITLAAPIGPSGVAIIQNGLRGGFWRAFQTAIGVIMADITYLLIVFFGLASFISYPVMKISIWSLGALVLVYLGVQCIRESRPKVDFETSPLLTARNPLLAGYLVNISNPIAVVWWVGIYGSLLGAASYGDGKLDALLRSSTILVGILMWHTSVSFLTHWGKRLLNETSARYISIIAGFILILFGIRFGYYAILTGFGNPGI